MKKTATIPPGPCEDEKSVQRETAARNDLKATYETEDAPVGSQVVNFVGVGSETRGEPEQSSDTKSGAEVCEGGV